MFLATVLDELVKIAQLTAEDEERLRKYVETPTRKRRETIGRILGGLGGAGGGALLGSMARKRLDVIGRELFRPLGMSHKDPKAMDRMRAAAEKSKPATRRAMLAALKVPGIVKALPYIGAGLGLVHGAVGGGMLGRALPVGEEKSRQAEAELRGIFDGR